MSPELAMNARLFRLILCAWCWIPSRLCFLDAFVPNLVEPHTRHSFTRSSSTILRSAAPVESFLNDDTFTTTTVLSNNRTVSSQPLLDLLTTMMGDETELRQVEQWIQALEESYRPPQTLGFFNWAQSGPWHFQFSTQYLNITQRRSFRLRQVRQDLQCHDFQGNITNTCLWELCQNDDGIFDCRGSFHIAGNYTLTSNGRLVWHPASVERTLQLAPGSTRPHNASLLIQWLQRSLAKELFDPTQHAVDTTYLDASLRIVRYAGPRFEGVRNIFVRTDAPAASAGAMR